MLGLGVGFYKVGGDTYPSGTWTPRSLGGDLMIHLKFKQGIDEVAANDDSGTERARQVAQWSDFSGKGNHAQPTASDDAEEMPTYQTDGSVLFDNALNSLVFGSALNLAAFAIYWRANWSNTINNDVPFEGNSTADFIKLASPTQIRIKIGGATREDATIDEITDDGTTYHNIGVERESNGNLFCSLDGAEGEFSQVSPKDGNTDIGTQFALTQIGDGTQNSKWIEVIIVGRALTAAERVHMNNYLNSIVI